MLAAEVCVESFDAAVAACRAAGSVGVAHLRLEVCSALHCGGLTPSVGLLRQLLSPASQSLLLSGSLKRVDLFAMLRSRAGLDFCYSPAEMEVMLADLDAFAALAAAKQMSVALKGFVFGALLRVAAGNSDSNNGTVRIPSASGIDVANTTRVVRRAAEAGGFTVTFHRAVDYLGADAQPTANPALFASCVAQVREAKCAYLLTSGGVSNSASTPTSLHVLATLIAASNRRGGGEEGAAPEPAALRVLVGGGVNSEVVARVRALLNGVPTAASIALFGVHFSAKRVMLPEVGVPDGESWWTVDEQLAAQLLAATIAPSKTKTTASKL